MLVRLLRQKLSENPVKWNLVIFHTNVSQCLTEDFKSSVSVRVVAHSQVILVNRGIEEIISWVRTEQGNTTFIQISRTTELIGSGSD